ncbi:MAG: hypothetical protein ACKVP4_02485, partial [Hyphomicrobium sp.]
MVPGGVIKCVGVKVPRRRRNAAVAKKRSSLGLAAVLALNLLPSIACAAKPDKGVGINLHDVVYWAPVLVFNDLFKQTSQWIPQKRGSDEWNTGRPMDLDPDGWPRRLIGDQILTTLINPSVQYPNGFYRLSYEGKGKVVVDGDAEIVKTYPDGARLRVSTAGGLFIKVLQVDPSDPVRKISLRLAETNGAAMETFNPEYRRYLQGFNVLRYMGWANTNDNKISNWAERSRPEHGTQERHGGVALEYMIDFANYVGASPWFTIPTAADDNYVREMAKLIKER